MPDPAAATLRVRAVVLAAGAARRFGSDKLLAELDGRPLLQHVLDRLADAGLDDPIVVVPPEHAELRSRLRWRRSELVVNPRPADGMSSSLRLGWAAAFDGDPLPDAVLVVLGDQPRISSAVVRALLVPPLDPGRPIVAPRYRAGGGSNPVRIDASAGALVQATTGDRGLGPVIEARPEIVRFVEARGSNPDVDSPSDLARLAG